MAENKSTTPEAEAEKAETEDDEAVETTDNGSDEKAETVALAGKVDRETAAGFRILAIVQGKTVAEALGDLITAEVKRANVVITVGGKPLGG